MRILFLYAKFESPYHGFRKFEVNFSRDRHFSVNDDGDLLEKPASIPVPEDFWDEGKQIYNVSALVGRNAAGKTTILQYLASLLSKFFSSDPHTPTLLPTNHSGFLVFQDSDALYEVSYHVDSDYQWSSSVVNHESDASDFSSIFARLKPIYLSNTLTLSDYILARELRRFDNKEPTDRSAYVYNASQVAWLMKSSASNRYAQLDSFANYTFEEQYRQIKFVFNPSPSKILRGLHDQGVPVPCAEYITVSFIDNPLLFSLFNEERLMKFFPNAYSALKSSSPTSSTTFDAFYRLLVLQFSQLAAIDFVIYALSASNLAASISRVEGLLQTIESSFDESVPQKASLPYDDYYYFIDTVHKCCIKSGLLKDNNFLDSLKSSTKGFIQFIHSSNPGLEDLQPFIYEPHFSSAGSINIISEFKIKAVTTSPIYPHPFLLFLYYYRLLPQALNFLNFSWGLSSGETTLLSIFSNLYHLRDYSIPSLPYAAFQLQNQVESHSVPCDSILLMIDEADMTLHPEWQRKFLAGLTAFLPKLYPEIKDIQIILTTHSPLMLGDIPSQCVTYFSKDENGEITSDTSGTRFTFGQNIYLLLKDSFYLEDSALGPIAQRKLQAVIEQLKAIPEKADGLPAEAIHAHLNALDKIQHETVDLLAPGIIKSKLKEEIERRRVVLRVVLQALLPIDYTQLSLEELKRQQEAINAAIGKKEASAHDPDPTT